MKKNLASLLSLFSLLLFTSAQAQPNTFPANGFVGIGTTNPQQRLHVEGSSNQAIFVNTTALGAASGSGMIGSAKALPTGANQRLGYFLVGSRGGAQNGYNAAGMVGYSGGAWSAEASHPAYLAFETTNSGSDTRQERMRINANGNVGIGTTAPERKLHIFNGSAGAVTSNPDAAVVVEDNNNNFINMLAPNTVENGILFGNPGNAQDGGIIYSNSTDAMQFRTNGNVTRMTLSSTGNLDIAGGNLSFGSVETFADAGAFTISSNSDFVSSSDGLNSLGQSGLRWSAVWAVDGTINTSDLREKANVRELEYGMKEIMQLRATRFNWKQDAGKSEKLGLIAQDLQKVLPEVVRDWEYKVSEETGKPEKVATARLGVAYADIIPVLIKGMQEQQAQIEDLKREISQLKGGITTYTGIGSLGQSTPNPVHSTTRISYNLPSANSRAQLLFTDAGGKTVKAISLNGSGYVNFNVTGLASGIYNYSLLVDGRIVETKRLEVVRNK